MRAEHTPRFSDLLRRARSAAGLTQEDLAEAAGVSARAISNLERGINRVPHKYTRELLADALALTEEERAQWASACQIRTRRPADSAASASRMDPENLTRSPPIPGTRLFGRESDTERVVERLRSPGVRLVTISGTGG